MLRIIKEESYIPVTYKDYKDMRECDIKLDVNDLVALYNGHALTFEANEEGEYSCYCDMNTIMNFLNYVEGTLRYEEEKLCYKETHGDEEVSFGRTN